MKTKDKEEFETDGFRIKVVREERGSQEYININVYNGGDTIRGYEQHNFRVKEDKDAKVATYVSKKYPAPSVTAIRALYEYGWACDNFNIDDVIEQEDMETLVRSILGIHDQLDIITSNDPTMNRMVSLSGRILQHAFGFYKNAEYYEDESVTAFFDKLSQDEYSATYDELLDFDEEMRLALLFTDKIIEEEHGFSFVDQVVETER